MPRSPQHTTHVTSHHLAGWHRWGVYLVGTLLLITGAIWLALHYLVGAGAGDLPHPFEAWMMRAHGLAGFAAMFMFGTVTAVHLPHGWRLTRRQRWAQQRRTGLLLCAFAAVLLLSAYLLYYFAPEAIRPALGWIHTAVGLAMGGVLALHRRGV